MYKTKLIATTILSSMNTFCQSIVSATDYKEIVQQIKQRPLDSISKYQKNFGEISKTLTVSGYLESYYSYDFARPDHHIRQPFVYSYNRSNEFNVNLALVKLTYNSDNIRANIGLMTGTYSNDNLKPEQGFAKNIYEANAGIKISKTKNIWIDLGIMPSHIGFESAIGKDCWTLTRSILADNSPYYETGIKISYTSDNKKWFINGLALNGWQRIYQTNKNNTPAFGHQLTFKPNSKITLNSSSFIGNSLPENIKKMRYFHNLYGQLQLNKKFGLTLGFDIGAEQKAKTSNTYNVWYSPILITKYNLTEKHSITACGEYYNDKKEIIIITNTPNGFQTWGYSLNYSYQITNHIMWRMETRRFSSKDKIFMLHHKPDKNNIFITTSLALSL